MVYAGKIVSKQLLQKPHQKDKMAQEISIHRALLHKHVVGFHSFFEDTNFVFIVLELCKRRVNACWLLVISCLFLQRDVVVESHGVAQKEKGNHRTWSSVFHASVAARCKASSWKQDHP